MRFQFRPLVAAKSNIPTTGISTLASTSPKTSTSQSRTSFLQRFQKNNRLPPYLASSTSEIISLRKSGSTLNRVLQEFSGDLLIRTPKSIQATAKNNVCTYYTF